METELKKPNVGHYLNAEHIEFHKMAYDIINRHKDLINAPAMLAAYQAKVAQEATVYKWLRSSEFTEKKAETDRERDRILSGITDVLHGYEKHFDPAIRDKARHVLHLIDNYHNLEQTGYDAETAGIDSIIEKLAGSDYLPDVQALNLGLWLTELDRLNTLFKSYAADAEQEQVDKPGINPKAARRETDEALRLITQRVTAIITIDGPEESAGLIAEYNVHVNHYNTLLNEHYGRLHAKTDISGGEVAPIDVQPWTGKAVCVIPGVKIRRVEKDGTVTVVELVFSVDFTVKYKNNVDRGTATIIITGIGKYTGEIITTFNISD
ncbi:MAG: DUF6261 family protein [Dysgonamonadaceae bacterium]|jgi:hypothetical protein|nr:DUF6261 family protein [Dysgonamonadaceae bacterium]